MPQGGRQRILSTRGNIRIFPARRISFDGCRTGSLRSGHRSAPYPRAAARIGAEEAGVARHAEIAGAGIGGLGLGIMLARHGWSVRVHERSPAIREIGSGISLRNNCIEVLEHYGIFPRLEPHGTMLRLERHFDWRGRFVQQRSFTGHHRTLVLPRQNSCRRAGRRGTGRRRRDRHELADRGGGDVGCTDWRGRSAPSCRFGGRGRRHPLARPRLLADRGAL